MQVALGLRHVGCGRDLGRKRTGSRPVRRRRMPRRESVGGRGASVRARTPCGARRRIERDGESRGAPGERGRARRARRRRILRLESAARRGSPSRRVPPRGARRRSSGWRRRPSRADRGARQPRKTRARANSAPGTRRRVADPMWRPGDDRAAGGTTAAGRSSTSSAGPTWRPVARVAPLGSPSRRACAREGGRRQSSGQRRRPSRDRSPLPSACKARRGASRSPAAKSAGRNASHAASRTVDHRPAAYPTWRPAPIERLTAGTRRGTGGRRRALAAGEFCGGKASPAVAARTPHIARRRSSGGICDRRPDRRVRQPGERGRARRAGRWRKLLAGWRRVPWSSANETVASTRVAPGDDRTAGRTAKIPLRRKRRMQRVGVPSRASARRPATIERRRSSRVRLPYFHSTESFAPHMASGDDREAGRARRGPENARGRVALAAGEVRGGNASHAVSRRPGAHPSWRPAAIEREGATVADQIAVSAGRKRGRARRARRPRTSAVDSVARRGSPSRRALHAPPRRRSSGGRWAELGAGRAMRDRHYYPDRSATENRRVYRSSWFQVLYSHRTMAEELGG